MNTKDKDKIKNIETKYKSVDNKMLDINSQLTDLIEFMGQSKETLFENLKQLEKEALLESAINFNLKEKNCSDDLNFIDMKFDESSTNNEDINSQIIKINSKKVEDYISDMDLDMEHIRKMMEEYNKKKEEFESITPMDCAKILFNYWKTNLHISAQDKFKIIDNEDSDGEICSGGMGIEMTKSTLKSNQIVRSGAPGNMPNNTKNKKVNSTYIGLEVVPEESHSHQGRNYLSEKLKTLRVSSSSDKNYSFNLKSEEKFTRKYFIKDKLNSEKQTSLDISGKKKTKFDEKLLNPCNHENQVDIFPSIEFLRKKRKFNDLIHSSTKTDLNSNFLIPSTRQKSYDIKILKSQGDRKNDFSILSNKLKKFPLESTFITNSDSSISLNFVAKNKGFKNNKLQVSTTEKRGDYGVSLQIISKNEPSIDLKNRKIFNLKSLTNCRDQLFSIYSSKIKNVKFVKETNMLQIISTRTNYYDFGSWNSDGFNSTAKLHTRDFGEFLRSQLEVINNTGSDINKENVIIYISNNFLDIEGKFQNLNNNNFSNDEEDPRYIALKNLRLKDQNFEAYTQIKVGLLNYDLLEKLKSSISNNSIKPYDEIRIEEKDTNILKNGISPRHDPFHPQIHLRNHNNDLILFYKDKLLDHLAINPPQNEIELDKINNNIRKYKNIKKSLSKDKKSKSASHNNKSQSADNTYSNLVNLKLNNYKDRVKDKKVNYDNENISVNIVVDSPIKTVVHKKEEIHLDEIIDDENDSQKEQRKKVINEKMKNFVFGELKQNNNNNCNNNLQNKFHLNFKEYEEKREFLPKLDKDDFDYEADFEKFKKFDRLDSLTYKKKVELMNDPYFAQKVKELNEKKFEEIKEEKSKSKFNINLSKNESKSSYNHSKTKLKSFDYDYTNLNKLSDEFLSTPRMESKIASNINSPFLLSLNNNSNVVSTSNFLNERIHNDLNLNGKQISEVDRGFSPYSKNNFDINTKSLINYNSTMNTTNLNSVKFHISSKINSGQFERPTENIKIETQESFEHSRYLNKLKELKTNLENPKPQINILKKSNKNRDMINILRKSKNSHNFEDQNNNFENISNINCKVNFRNKDLEQIQNVKDMQFTHCMLKDKLIQEKAEEISHKRIVSNIELGVNLPKTTIDDIKYMIDKTNGQSMSSKLEKKLVIKNQIKYQKASDVVLSPLNDMKSKEKQSTYYNINSPNIYSGPSLTHHSKYDSVDSKYNPQSKYDFLVPQQKQKSIIPERNFLESFKENKTKFEYGNPYDKAKRDLIIKPCNNLQREELDMIKFKANVISKLKK